MEQLIRPLLPANRGLICITAPPGGGKSCALNYLRCVLPEVAPAQFFNTDAIANALDAAATSLAFLATENVDPAWNSLAVFELKPWTLDDCIEYLAHEHRKRLPEVMEQLAKDPMTPRLNGSPELLALVMDDLVAEPVVLSLGRGMHRRVQALHVPQRVRDALVSERLRIENNKPDASWRCVDIGNLPGWFRHEVPQRCWIGQEIAERLSRHDYLSLSMETMRGQEFVDDIAAAVSRNHDARRALEALIFDNPSHHQVPMAASILLRVDPAWRPPSRKHLNLRGAILRNARWQNIQLPKADLCEADCTGADLRNANLSKAVARSAVMTGAKLNGALLQGAELQGAQLQNADLTAVQARQVTLDGANLSAAKLLRAELSSAQMVYAVLLNARLKGARLDGATLMQSVVDGADFTDADFTGAIVKAVDMSEAAWNGTCFYKAIVRTCNLEGLEIANADFRRADLTKSFLTASRMINGNFEGAGLEAAGLAEIDWTGANLRGANLCNASFHLGSSRSGLVGSTTPCEGSRTGFYTDEFNEQTYKSAEEIRKACLCGADLRGAVLTHTDFYLVDLRRARYSDEQRKHFQRCGAILVSRVPD